MKILLTLLAVAVCADATINLAPLLDLLSPAPRALPVAAPVGPGEASYYRQARGPVGPGEASYYRQARGPVGPGDASYYRQAPAAVGPGEASYYRKAPAPVASGEASYYRQAPAPAPAPAPGYASYYRQAPAPAPVPANSGYASYYRHAPTPAPKVASYYRQAPAPAPVPAPANSGYASYYRKAAAPVAAPANSGYASYYRKAPAPAPAPVHVVPAEPSPIVRVIQPIIYLPRPTAKPASYYRHPAPPKESHVVLPPAVHTAAPVVSSTFTVQEPFTKVHHQTPAKTEFSIVPSESFSFSFPNANAASNSGAQVQSLPQTAINVPFNSASAGTTVQNLKADYGVETVKSEGHSYALPEERITIEKTPSQSFSYSYANADANSGAKVQSLPQTTLSYANANMNSGAQVQSLPQTIINQPFNLASAGASTNTLQSDYFIQKSDSHSYKLPDEQITLQNSVAPETTVEAAALQNIKLDIRGSKAFEEAPVAVVASADATAVVDDDNDDDDSRVAPVVQTVAAAEEPASIYRPIVVAPTVETNAQAVAEVDSYDSHEEDEPEPVKQLAPVQPFAPAQPVAAPQPLATVTLDQEDITQQILQQAIPDVVNKVTPHLIQQAIPLIVDRAVPQIVYQVGEQQRKQAENVQIVTPFNRQQQQQKDDEKVFVMYATSLPQGQSQANFNLRGQFDESENLVVPIGNRNQFNGAASSASAHSNSQAHSGPKFVFEKGIDAGSYVEEERRSVGNVKQQIISNFQRENAAYQQEQRGRVGSSANSFSRTGSQQQGGSFASASSFSGAGAQQNRGQFLNQSQQQYRQ